MSKAPLGGTTSGDDASFLERIKAAQSHRKKHGVTLLGVGVMTAQERWKVIHPGLLLCAMEKCINIHKRPQNP